MKFLRSRSVRSCEVTIFELARARLPLCNCAEAMTLMAHATLTCLALGLVARAPPPRMAAPRFDAADFAATLERRTVTAQTYAGVPLAEDAGLPRARVLTALTRQLDAEMHPGAVIEDAEAGTCVDGSRRGQNQAPYDWQRDGRRVTCKSAQLIWDASKRYWKLQFKNVKLGFEGEEPAFDELLLVAYTPRGLYVHRHGGRLGVSTSGKATAATGSQIAVYGPVDEPEWSAALDDAVLPKLEEGGCKRLAFVPFDDPRFLAAP